MDGHVGFDSCTHDVPEYATGIARDMTCSHTYIVDTHVRKKSRNITAENLDLQQLDQRSMGPYTTTRLRRHG